MNGGTGNIGLWRDRGVAQPEADVEAQAARGEDAPIFGDHHYEDGPPDFEGGRPWPAIAAAGLLSAGWLGLFGWGAWSSLDGAAPGPALIAQWIATASAPLALIGVLYVLLQRNSRAEARRFGRTAAALRAESASLEAALAIAASKLEDNRASLAAHIADLVARGDDAARSLAGINTAIGAEGEAISRHASTLKTSATAARADMAVLLASLPKAHSQTQEMVISLQEAGFGVHERAGALEAQLSALVARGREADEVAGGAAQRLGAHLARIENTSEAAGDRLEQAARQMTSAVDIALAKAAEAVDAARQGMDAQAEAMRAMVEQSRAAIERTGHDSAAALGSRLNEMGARVEALGTALAQQDATSRAMLERLGRELAEVDARLESLDNDGTDRAERLSAAMINLQDEAERARAMLEAGGATADGFTVRMEALLVSLDASAREIDETLPAAFNRLSGHARQAKATMGSIAPELDRLESATASVLAQLAEAEALLEDQHRAVTMLVETGSASLAENRRHVADLGEAIDATDAQARGFAERAGPLLVDALLRVRETANQAADKARAALANVIPEAAERLGQEAGDSMRRALLDRVQSQMDDVAAGAERAVSAAQQASDRLDQQMLTIADSSAALEARIAEARAEAETANNDSFARRVSLLIESLNSTAIDVAKILSNDVTDSAWAAYLKGDRGVFARRAVRLLEAGEVREIARHYDSEPEFREQVNRYIHDFEAMLRTVLATRDGSPLGVTLLSSDNGKLYVALAQAIERLR